MHNRVTTCRVRSSVSIFSLEISTLEHQNTGTIPINDIHGVVLFSEKDNDKRKRKWPKGVRAPSPPSNSTPIMIKSVAGHQSWFAGLDDVSARRFVAAVHNAVAWSDASDLEQLAHEYHVLPEGLKWNPISFSDSSEKLEEVCLSVFRSSHQKLINEHSNIYNRYAHDSEIFWRAEECFCFDITTHLR